MGSQVQGSWASVLENGIESTAADDACGRRLVEDRKPKHNRHDRCHPAGTLFANPLATPWAEAISTCLSTAGNRRSS